jgi:RimJ/RimL family protein N-acetyltransferase
LKEGKQDDDFLMEIWNDKQSSGEYESTVRQLLKTEIDRQPGGSPFDSVTERTLYLIERLKGEQMEPVGFIAHFMVQPYNVLSMFFALSNKEDVRHQGYGTQAVKDLTNRLFQNKDLERVQAMINENDKAAQKVLEKAGFQKEAKLRKAAFIRGNWKDQLLYSILKDEWKKRYPKILNE